MNNTTPLSREGAIVSVLHRADQLGHELEKLSTLVQLIRVLPNRLLGQIEPLLAPFNAQVRRKTPDEKRNARIVAMLAEGKSMRQVADELHIPHGSIYYKVAQAKKALALAA